MEDSQFKTLLSAIRKVDSNQRETNQVVVGLQTAVAVMQEKLSQFVTWPELFGIFNDHINKDHAKKSSSTIPRPSSDGDKAKVTWGSILKYTSIIFTAVGLGFTVGKLLG
jgi:hypothetical protein